MPFLLFGGDGSWVPRDPVLAAALVEPHKYAGTCPVCGNAWTSRRRVQVACSKACACQMARDAAKAPK